MEGNLKPQMTTDDVSKIAAKTFGLITASVEELNSYDDRNFFITVSKCVNPNLEPICSEGYILKIINALDSQNPGFFQAQDDILLALRKIYLVYRIIIIFLGDKNISAPIPQPNLSGELISYEVLRHTNAERIHIIRLFDYKPGKILKSVSGDYQLYYQVGAVAALMDNALKVCFNFYFNHLFMFFKGLA